MIQILDDFASFARIYRAGFSNYARTWSVYYESDSEWMWYSVLMRIASNFEFRRLLDISKPDAVPSAFFFGNNLNEQDEEKDIIKRLDFYKREADLTKDNSFGFTVLLLLYHLHLLLVGT